MTSLDAKDRKLAYYEKTGQDKTIHGRTRQNYYMTKCF